MNKVLGKGIYLKESIKQGVLNKVMLFKEDTRGASTLEWLMFAFLALGIAVFLWLFKARIATIISNIAAEIEGWSNAS